MRTRSIVFRRFFAASLVGATFVSFLNGFPSPFSQFDALSSAEATAATPDKTSRPDLFAPIAIECDGVALESWLRRYSDIYGFSYFIDRRVDPTTPISGSFSNESFVLALRKMLAETDLSFCVVNNSILYVGPAKSAGELLLLFVLKREESAEFPKQVAAKLSASFDFTTKDFAESRETFQDLAKRSRLKFLGFEKTPFNRRRAVEFRNVVASDLTTMFLYDFNADYRWEAESGALKPIALDRSREVRRVYPEEFAKKLDKTQFSTCQFSDETIDGAKSTVVVGTFADVATVEDAIVAIQFQHWSEEAQKRVPSDATAVDDSSASKESSGVRKEVSGSIENKTLRALFDYLKTNVKIEFSLDPSLVSSGVTLDTRISCEFRKADVRKIAATIADKIDAEYRIDGAKVVFSKER